MPTKTQETKQPANFLARFFFRFLCLVAKKMLEIKDPAIKLFGKKIPLPADAENPPILCEDLSSPVTKEVFSSEGEKEEDSSGGKATETTQPDGTPPPSVDESTDPEILPDKKKVLNGTRNGVHSFEEQEIPVPCRAGENGDDCSSGSSITVSNPVEEGIRNCVQEPLIRNVNGFPSPIPCLPGVPWPYPWNAAVPPPAFCPSGYPMSFYPAPFWNFSSVIAYKLIDNNERAERDIWFSLG
ncbi:hypothetical protein Pint_16124 [Pistacia integerrima]|uniref:Uncharacterized protein n=1 Tax=Pistacia integerrima TaxID=434235 RepID=A0ACC0ZAU8_9ROSI|nr:hypothetical protein Pint_16124 [Pistacia integerrima]